MLTTLLNGSQQKMDKRVYNQSMLTPLFSGSQQEKDKCTNFVNILESPWFECLELGS